jgi:tetratricopeptide (TPR) repeat protein
VSAPAEQLREIETRTEAVLGSLEQDGRWAEALQLYHSAGAEVDALEIPKTEATFKEARQLRAFLYLREANALRALGRAAEAAELGHRELDAAMASGDSLSIARALFSLGGTYLANGESERGQKFLNDSRPLFEHIDDADHRQGLGWWHIIQADINNNGLAPGQPEAALKSAEAALEILRPLSNWPGIARAHAARVQAYKRMGEVEQARVATAAQKMAEAMLKTKP